MLDYLSSCVSTEVIFVLRVFIASVCGGIIGYERSQRQKDAGIRTHIIVALGSALCMVISKYGFDDVLSGGLGYSTDASRIAANIITGISFLCAGVIFIKEQSVKGLTTAAGIWATAAVGMAIGAGMYFTGICTTVILIILQVVLHRLSSKIEGNQTKGIYIELNSDADCSFELGAIVTRFGSTLQSIERRSDNGLPILHMVIIPKNAASLEQITDSIRQIDVVKDLFVE